QELSIQEMEDLKQQYLDELKRLSNLEYRDEIKIAELKENFNCMSIEIRKKEKLQQLEQLAYLSTHSSKRFNSFCYDDDDEDYTIAVTPSLSNEEPDNSLKISSGSPTTRSDSSLYASFIFDLSINPLPPADMSDFYEFIDELIPFISSPEYDCFLFKVEPNSRDFTKDVVEDISPTKEQQVHNALPTHPSLQLNMKF
nr:hypothetical protein [Tanacetum cinerariifolium]